MKRDTQFVFHKNYFMRKYKSVDGKLNQILIFEKKNGII